MLRQQGLVETRRGRAGGTFVRRPTAPQLGLLRDRLRAMTIGELRDLTDEQSAVSGAAARLAATRASTVGVRRLLTLADQLARPATAGARIMADSRFHIEVAIASKSERLTTLEVALQTKLAEFLWLPGPPASTRIDAGPDPARPARGGRRARGDRGRDRGGGRIASPPAGRGARGGQPPPPHRAPASAAAPAVAGGREQAARAEATALLAVIKRRALIAASASRFLLLSDRRTCRLRQRHHLEGYTSNPQRAASRSKPGTQSRSGSGPSGALGRLGGSSGGRFPRRARPGGWRLRPASLSVLTTFSSSYRF